MRKVLLRIVPLALVGLAVFYLLWGPGGRPPEPPRPSAGADNGAAGALQGELPEETRAAALDVQREELQTAGAEPSAPPDLYRIRVIHKETGEPVPGASVSYYEESTNVFARFAQGPVNHEVEAQERGETVLAGDQGIALVTVEQIVRITGRHENHYGERFLAAVVNRDPEQEHDLVLEPDMSLTVRVVDFRGEPAEGVRVGIAPLQEGTVTQFQPIGTSSEDGRVLQAHLQLRAAGASGAYRLRPLIPGFTEGGVTVDPEDPPKGPIEIRLPPTGRVRVTLVDVHGNPLPQFPLTLVRLAIPPDEMPDDASGSLRLEWPPEHYEGGTAIFERVVAGRGYRAWAALRIGRAEGLLTGPRQQDDDVRFELRMDTSYYGLAGRIVREDGSPLAGTRVRARFEAEGVQGGGSFATEPDGTFWVFLRPAERDTTLFRLSFEVRRTGDAPLRSAPIQGGALVLGTNDVGDVVLSEPRSLLVGSGRLLVDGETITSWPAGGFRVLQWDAAAERWSVASNSEIAQGPEGSFEIHTVDPAERFRVEYRVPDTEPYLPAPPLEFGAGAEGLEVNLVTSGFLRAYVLTGGTPPFDNLWLRLVPLEGQFPDVDPNDGPGNTKSPSANILYARPGDASGGLQPFRWEKLEPGRYLLQVVVRGGRSLLLTVPDIRIEKGPNEDPRLRGIDLRGSLRQILVTVSDPAGEPIPAGVFLQAPGAQRLEAYLTRGRSAAILLSDPYVDLLVAARDYRPQVVEAVASDTQVTLQPNSEVLVRIAGGLPELDAGRVLEVSVESERPPDDRRYMMDRGDSGGMDYFLRPRVTTGHFEDANEVILQTAGAGSYRVSLSVVNTTLRRSHPIPGLEPTRVELTGEDRQVLELRVSAEGLAEALQHVR